MHASYAMYKLICHLQSQSLSLSRTPLNLSMFLDKYTVKKQGDFHFMTNFPLNDQSQYYVTIRVFLMGSTLNYIRKHHWNAITDCFNMNFKGKHLIFPGPYLTPSILKPETVFAQSLSCFVFGNGNPHPICCRSKAYVSSVATCWNMVCSLHFNFLYMLQYLTIRTFVAMLNLV